MQYANFMPGEWLPWEDKGYLRSIYQYVQEIGVGLGGPDLMVQRTGQLNHTIAMMHEYDYTVPLGIAIQDDYSCIFISILKLNLPIMKKVILPILLATIWISISEFVRNEFLLKSYWINHYEKLGMVFPSAPVNGAVWGIWSLCFAIAIFFIAKKFSLLQTFLLSWFIGFILMWLVVGNMGVLPYNILVFAVPLSLLEVFLAAAIIKRLSK